MNLDRNKKAANIFSLNKKYIRLMACLSYYIHLLSIWILASIFLYVLSKLETSVQGIFEWSKQYTLYNQNYLSGWWMFFLHMFPFFYSMALYIASLAISLELYFIFVLWLTIWMVFDLITSVAIIKIAKNKHMIRNTQN